MTQKSPKDKHYFRHHSQSRLKKLTDKDKKTFSQTICSLIYSLPELKNAATICLYKSLPDEVQTEELLSTLRLSHQIGIPVVNKETLLFKKIDSTTHYTSNAYGILEPTNGEILSPEKIDLCILPGRAFDTTGTRIGRGKGYYDKALMKLSAVRIGLAFSVQIFPLLPKNSYDIVMDIIVTEEGIYRYEDTTTS